MSKRTSSISRDMADFEAALLRSIEQAQRGADQVHAARNVHDKGRDFQANIGTPNHNASASIQGTNEMIDSSVGASKQ